MFLQKFKMYIVSNYNNHIDSSLKKGRNKKNKERKKERKKNKKERKKTTSPPLFQINTV